MKTIDRLLPSNRKLEQVLRQRERCTDDFKDTAQKVNGHLKKQVKKARDEKLSH